MALFQLMTYPESTKDSMLTICTFPLSVPMYNHLLWNGRSHCVILKDKNNMVICSEHTIQSQDILMYNEKLSYYSRLMFPVTTELEEIIGQR